MMQMPILLSALALRHTKFIGFHQEHLRLLGWQKTQTECFIALPQNIAAAEEMQTG
jgi:hypothetical protein